MKLSKKLIKEAIKKYGDDFWNDIPQIKGVSTNRVGLVDEIFELVHEHGYTIKVTKTQ